MSITRTFAKWFANYDRQSSGGSRLRAKRIAPLLAMMDRVADEYGSVNIIDVGGTERYWNIVPGEHLDRLNVTVTIVNIPPMPTPEDHGRFRFVAADGCDLSVFADKSFHIGHSNSVIEHVGDWDRMVQFAREISRVASRYFVQTPNYWFPVEPHCMTPFFHWLPKPTRIWLISNFQLGHWSKAASIGEAVRTAESARLLNKKMLGELFNDGHVVTERFLGLAKSFIAIKDGNGK